MTCAHDAALGSKLVLSTILWEDVFTVCCFDAEPLCFFALLLKDHINVFVPRQLAARHCYLAAGKPPAQGPIMLFDLGMTHSALKKLDAVPKFT